MKRCRLTPLTKYQPIDKLRLSEFPPLLLTASPEIQRSQFMEMQVENHDDYTLIKLIGRFDLEAHSQHEMRFSAHTATNSGKVILDLTELEMIVSLSIGLLVSSSKAIKGRGGKMVIVTAPGVVRDTLEMMQLNLAIDMVESVEDAIAA